MNERFRSPTPESEENKPVIRERGNRLSQVDFAITERTYFGRPAPDNTDYNEALEEGKIEEYTTPEGEKRVRYTEKFWTWYDEVVNRIREERKIIDKKTLEKPLAPDERFAQKRKTYVPEEESADKPEYEKSRDKLSKSEKLSELLTREAVQTLWSFFEEKGLKDKIKDIVCVKKDKKGGKKSSKPHFEASIYLQRDSEYIFLTGTIEKITKDLENELENLTEAL